MRNEMVDDENPWVSPREVVAKEPLKWLPWNPILVPLTLATPVVGLTLWDLVRCLLGGQYQLLPPVYAPISVFFCASYIGLCFRQPWALGWMVLFSTWIAFLSGSVLLQVISSPQPDHGASTHVFLGVLAVNSVLIVLSCLVAFIMISRSRNNSGSFS